VRETIFDNKTVELGAQWIHVPGEDHIMKRKADQYKMKFYLDDAHFPKDYDFRYSEIILFTLLFCCILFYKKLN